MFRSKEHRVKLSNLKSMIMLALADGRLDEAESRVIAAVCGRDNISMEELNRCLKEPDSVEFIAPADPEAQIKHLRDLVCLMICDGNIDENEMKVCRVVAHMLGFRPEVIDALLEMAIKDIQEELDMK